MTRNAQGSLFGDTGMAAPAKPSSPDPQAIRARLDRLVQMLRSAGTMPFSDRDQRMWQAVVPNMARWLPDEEAEAFCVAFAVEMERLGIARGTVFAAPADGAQASRETTVA